MKKNKRARLGEGMSLMEQMKLGFSMGVNRGHSDVSLNWQDSKQKSAEFIHKWKTKWRRFKLKYFS